MQSYIQPPQQTTGKRANRHKVFILVAIIILVACGLTMYFWPSSKPKPQLAPGQHPQSYSTLESYKLVGAKTGQGIVFSRPPEYQLVSLTPDKTQVSFSDTIKKPPMFAPLGSIWLATVGYHGSTSQLKTYFTTALASKSASNYQQALSGLEKFVSARFSPLYDLSYSSPQPLTTTNLKSDAWTLDFSAAPMSKYAGSPGLENYKGRLVFALGNNAYYYLMAYGTVYNWDNNQSTWQQVDSSINIDQ